MRSFQRGKRPGHRGRGSTRDIHPKSPSRQPRDRETPFAGPASRPCSAPQGGGHRNRRSIRGRGSGSWSRAERTPWCTTGCLCAGRRRGNRATTPTVSEHDHALISDSNRLELAESGHLGGTSDAHPRAREDPLLLHCVHCRRVLVGGAGQRRTKAGFSLDRHFSSRSSGQKIRESRVTRARRESARCTGSRRRADA